MNLYLPGSTSLKEKRRLLKSKETVLGDTLILFAILQLLIPDSFRCNISRSLRMDNLPFL